MAHLTPAELIDLAEGARPEASVPHLEACAACRAQVDEVRATMSAVAEIDAPEPSPLFWDHLSARVRETIAAEQDLASPLSGVRRVTDAMGASWRGWRPVWVVALAVLVAAAGLVIRTNQPSTTSAPAAEVAAISEPSAEVAAPDDDPSFSLVADLAADLDWESAREAGLTTHVGADDDAVGQFTDGERRELRRLLQGELSRSGRGA